MKKTLALAAILATTGFAMAEGTDNVVDISGYNTWDLLGDTDNETLSVDVAAAMGLPSGTPVIMNGIGWDVEINTIGASWYSEARISFAATGEGQHFNLAPGAADGEAGDEGRRYTSDVLKLADVGIDDLLLSDGMLHLEFYESFDDVADAIDGFFGDQSFLTIQAVEVPAPAALALLGVAGIAGNRRRRG